MAGPALAHRTLRSPAVEVHTAADRTAATAGNTVVVNSEPRGARHAAAASSKRRHDRQVMAPFESCLSSAAGEFPAAGGSGGLGLDVA
jgi:hypothetical protein